MRSLKSLVVVFFMRLALVYLLPGLQLTSAFPKAFWISKLRSIDALHLYQPEQDVKTVMNASLASSQEQSVKSILNVTSASTDEQPSLRELCRDMMKNTAAENQSLKRPRKPFRLANKVDNNDEIKSENIVAMKGDQAIEQVSKILDIFNTTTENESFHMSSPCDDRLVASKSIEGLLRRFVLLQQKEVKDNVLPYRLLDRLESLVWRCHENKILPTQSSLELLWSLQKNCFMNHCDKFEDQHQKQRFARQHVARSLRLWKCWSEWAYEYPSQISLPTVDFAEDILSVACDTEMPMTGDLWSVYQQTVSKEPVEQNMPRGLFAAVLGILSASSPTWQRKQTGVLKRVYAIYRINKDSDFRPTVAELQSALKVAAKAGLSSDATWLYECLSNQATATYANATIEAIQDDKELELWFTALCNDNNHDRTLPYLEYLLLFEKSGISQRLQSRQFFNQYLQKLARSSFPDAGFRAEAFLAEWKSKVEQETPSSIDSWCPDDESIDAVVQAHLQANGPTEMQRLQAQRFHNDNH